jgi:hypothetical protein
MKNLQKNRKHPMHISYFMPVHTVNRELSHEIEYFERQKAKIEAGSECCQ